jgi:hypothetical protein
MVRVPLPDLSEPERLVWEAFPRGEWVDLRTHDPAADDLARLAQAGPERGPGQFRALSVPGTVGLGHARVGGAA